MMADKTEVRGSRPYRTFLYLLYDADDRTCPHWAEVVRAYTAKDADAVLARRFNDPNGGCYLSGVGDHWDADRSELAVVHPGVYPKTDPTKIHFVRRGKYVVVEPRS